MTGKFKRRACRLMKFFGFCCDTECSPSFGIPLPFYTTSTNPSSSSGYDAIVTLGTQRRTPQDALSLNSCAIPKCVQSLNGRGCPSGPMRPCDWPAGGKLLGEMRHDVTQALCKYLPAAAHFFDSTWSGALQQYPSTPPTTLMQAAYAGCPLPAVAGTR